MLACIRSLLLFRIYVAAFRQPPSRPFFHLLLDLLSNRRDREAAQSSFPELLRHAVSHIAHTVNDLIHGNPAFNTRQRHIRAAGRVDRTHARTEEPDYRQNRRGA